ncbi:RNA ligase family protein [Allocoleopsis franciscana]|uniref:RNA ligase n=1 Tax=Allocoleopsis franciscana PCC 7113 TaxID=1173027 RepID=K9WBH4_9CYAN|nr:RNA ligase family protein [Allocoleopsis franciscana]AFZ17104.1 RNA ligase [Allocoleopsis franciscana PCC 7113]
MEKQNNSDWTYVSYEKISENLNKWNLTESDYRIFKKIDWVVTEKIHGANFGIVTDGLEVRFAKRKEFLQPEEDFFDYQSLKPQLVEQAKEIFKILQADWDDLLKVFVYGELFGGEYPHPDIPAVPHIQAVQTGIYYSPKIKYCAFDMAVEMKGNLVARDYLDYDKALNLFQQVGLMGTKPLFIGRYEEALAYNPEFDSTIPALLGLPKLPFKNHAEGIVIKPLKSIYVETHKGKIRPILKIKIPDFSEDSRFHQATKWTYQKATTLQAPTQGLSIEEELSQEMLALVTERRLINVISKIGRVSRSDWDKKQEVAQLLMQDVLETFNEEWESIFSGLSGENQQILMEQLHQKSQKLVEVYFN